MTDPRDISADLDPGLSAAERTELLAVGELLQRSRPAPRAAFRGELGRSLKTVEAPPRPPRLGLQIAAYSAAGCLLLAVAAAGVAGAGPFAA